MENFDIFRIYHLIRKKSQYPTLTDLMNTTFTEVLEHRGVISRREIREEALAALRKDGLPETEENLKEYIEALTDAYFATTFPSAEIENYINLARKREKAQTMSIVVNRDQATTAEIYRAVREFCEIPMGEVFISREEAEGTRVALISRFISSQLPFISLAKNHITIRDMDLILQRSLWSRRRPGKLGGKAAGMILAYKILLPLLEKHDPELEEYVRIPDTWFLNSGVFSEFLDRNNLYLFHTFKYKGREEIEREFLTIEEKFRNATFAPEVLDDFRGMLEEIGENPIIIRSSSLLEDSFGLAFSGKYQSVFLTNQGDLETRLAQMIEALKKVFASTFGPDPILYRMDHGLLDFDERMAMILQKVVGRRFGDYFFPLVSGVLFSRNVYAWNPMIRKEQGLGRLVFGLGTRAVDRVGSDYPRMVPFSHPKLRPEVTSSQIKKYSQKQVDVLNLKTGMPETVDFRTLSARVSHPDLFYAVAVEKDDHLAAPLFKGQDISGGEQVLTFDNLLDKTPFVRLARNILSRVEAAYGRPVDMEFAWDGDKFYLLQCRSLSTRKELEQVKIPENVPEGKVLFTTQAGLSNSVVEDVEYIVYVDPKAYDLLTSYNEKMEIAAAVNVLNRNLGEKRFALMGPGRWGSNDINLGVRVSYADINATRLLVEISFSREGYTPEVSYGTHFFQDLVEADIAVMPLFPDDPGSFLNEDFLLHSPNEIAAVDPALADYGGAVRVIRVPQVRGGQYLHVYLDGDSQMGAGVFGDAAAEPQNEKNRARRE
ncbi:MAG TPA: PEP/pyruvate-binding domain-containing protein [Thermodesulfobacteriota bacterium]|nr:PEP/pyruvate-binding domain-containing protein [Thermodesulfobacteriota bacterium]